MSAYVSEKYKIVPLSLNTSTTTAVKGQAVSLRNVGKVSVVCGYLVDQFVLDSAAEVESSLAHAATFGVFSEYLFLSNFAGLVIDLNKRFYGCAGWNAPEIQLS